MPLARSPARSLSLEQLAEALAIPHELRGETGVQRGKPRLMREELPDRDGLLARLGEAGPVPRQGIVVGEQTTRMGDGQDGRRDSLGRREHADERVLFPWHATSGVAHASPEIDQGFGAAEDGDGAT